MEAIMNYLLFGGGAADPLAPPPFSAAYAQPVCSGKKKSISRLNNSKCVEHSRKHFWSLIFLSPTDDDLISRQGSDQVFMIKTHAELDKTEI